MLDLDTVEDILTDLNLDFEPEVLCFKADSHPEEGEAAVHIGPPTATHYMAITCQHCDTGSLVLPVCLSYKEVGLMGRTIGATWVHSPGCESTNFFAESLEFTPIGLTNS